MTAIEWLEEKAKEFAIDLDLLDYFQQAKELEKKQIIDFTNDFIDKHTFGDYDGIVQKNKSVEGYYNETFKNK